LVLVDPDAVIDVPNVVLDPGESSFVRKYPNVGGVGRSRGIRKR